MDITRVVPVEWLEGRINNDGTRIIIADGTEYRVPYREQDGLKEGERVKFVPCKIRHRGKLWANKIIPMI